MNSILNILLEQNKHFLQALHACIGLDFKKDMHIFDISEKFTINQILKKAATAGYTPDNNIFVVITRGYAGYKSHYRVALIDKHGNINIDVTAYGYNNNQHVYYDYFYTKKDFESFRKDAYHTIIICQNRDFLKKPARCMNAEIDINQRFKLKKVNYCLYNNEKYISSLSLQLSTNNGQSYQHDILRYKTNNVSDLIDKSGYILFYHREALRRSAENIRHEKAKNKYLSIDNTEKINNLQVLIMQKKQEITGFLTDATTADELCIVNKKLSYFRGLESIFRHFESLVKFDREKKFNSIESFNNSYNDILSELNAI